MTSGEYLFAGQCLLSTDPQELRAAAREVFSDPSPWLEALNVEPLDLEREYVRLFLSPGGAICPPWQSVYAKEQEAGLLMGDAHSSALSFYREYGMAPSHGSEPADHAGLLLLFAGMLLDQGVPEDEFERYRIRHLEWIGELARRIEAETRIEFYRLLARQPLADARGSEVCAKE
ncbi:MAG: molecular chaperone TorD family protein [Acidobacteria bacterium]|nr:molecular chaperone TorD family protein [Acidobacteriota bacterium]